MLTRRNAARVVSEAPLYKTYVILRRAKGSIQQHVVTLQQSCAMLCEHVQQVADHVLVRAHSPPSPSATVYFASFSRELENNGIALQLQPRRLPLHLRSSGGLRLRRVGLQLGLQGEGANLRSKAHTSRTFPLAEFHDQLAVQLAVDLESMTGDLHVLQTTLDTLPTDSPTVKQSLNMDNIEMLRCVFATNLCTLALWLGSASPLTRGGR